MTKRPTLRQYEAEIAKGVGMAPYGPGKPATQSEIAGMARSYEKTYGKPKKPDAIAQQLGTKKRKKVAEDSPGFNPKTMGNRKAGPRDYPDYERPDRQIAAGRMKGKINP